MSGLNYHARIIGAVWNIAVLLTASRIRCVAPRPRSGIRVTAEMDGEETEGISQILGRNR